LGCFVKSNIHRSSPFLLMGDYRQCADIHGTVAQRPGSFTA
jgi:hypothetical protein